MDQSSTEATVAAIPLNYANSEVDRQFRYWRVRLMYSMVIGYAIFYIVRTNIGSAIPVMEKALHTNKASLGLIVTCGQIVYGISKFVNGFIGDRVNARYFMAIGLLCSAVMNFCFGLTSGLVTMGIFWLANGWFQGMGFPPDRKSVV